MRFKGLDLNLLAAFDALVETRSVSRAAERMNLSQPAMSAALSRLRTYFGDDILAPHGKRMHPTAYAESLLPQVRECLRGVERLIAISTRFDPVTSPRTFQIVASDYLTAAVIVPLVTRLAEIAPSMRIELNLPNERSHDQLDQGEVDLLITPEDYMSKTHPAELLYEERHVVVGWSGNPLFQGEISQADFLAHGHVAVALGNQRTPVFADRHLQMMGKTRRIDVTAASFTIVPWLLRDTLRLALMHERLAHAMVEFFPIAYAPSPFPLPPLREMVQFHQARGSDEGLSWLREQLRIVAATLGPSK